MALDEMQLEALAAQVANTPPSLGYWAGVWAEFHFGAEESLHRFSRFRELLKLEAWGSAAQFFYPAGWFMVRMTTFEPSATEVGKAVEVSLSDNRKFAIVATRSCAGGDDVVASVGCATLAAALRAQAQVLRTTRTNSAMSVAGGN